MNYIPKGWEWKRLSELSEDGLLLFQNGFACGKHNLEGRGYPQLRPMNIGTDGQIVLDELVFVEPEKTTIRRYVLRKKDVIFNNTNSRDLVGKTSIWLGEDGMYVLSNHMTIIRLKEEGIIDPSYLSKYLHHLWAVGYFKNACTPHVNQASISHERLANVRVPIPHLDTQRKIVAILDKAEETRRLRAQANELTQTLLQSVFLEMFGDPVENPKGWEVKVIDDLVTGKKSISCGPFGSQLKIGEYVGSGVPVLGIDNVEKDRFVWAKPKFVTPGKAKQLTEFVTTPGDVLVTRTGTVGRACVVPETIDEAIIGPNLLKIRFDRSKILPEFFSVALSYIPSMIRQIVMISPGATVAVLNTTNLRALKMIAPPMPIQNEYVKIVRNVKSTIDLQEDSTTYVVNLNETLLSRAFTGELVS